VVTLKAAIGEIRDTGDILARPPAAGRAEASSDFIRRAPHPNLFPQERERGLSTVAWRVPFPSKRLRKRFDRDNLASVSAE
jgi:hypothetical protein